MPQLDFTTYLSQVFWLLVVFSFIYYAASRMIIPKVEQILVQRQMKIDDYTIMAVQLSKEVQQLQTEYNQAMQVVSAAVNNIKTQNAARIEKLFSEKSNQLEKELNTQISEAEQEFKKFTDSFKEQQPKFCIELATTIIEKIISKSPDTKSLTKCYKQMQ